jgi:hypothetical protein
MRELTSRFHVSGGAQPQKPTGANGGASRGEDRELRRLMQGADSFTSR